MLFKNQKNHQQYQNFVKDQLIQLFILNTISSIVQFEHLIARLFLIDLDYLRELLIPTYNNPHHTPRDPVPLFRSLLLMTLLREPSKKLKKNQKLPPKHPRVVDKIVHRIMKNLNNKPYLGNYRIIYQFFMHCVVQQSANLGLLGNLNDIIVSGDGTHIKTGASPYGRKKCNCKKFYIENGQKVFNRCDCPRKFSDFHAAWGWDSYREQYVYGYTFYELIAASSSYDLPIFFIQAQASRHDSILAPLCADILRKLLPDEFNISKFLADSAHDNFQTYKLMDAFQYEPFIPMNNRNKDNLIYQACPANNMGVPICQAGEPMVYSGYCQDRMRIKWRCPLKANKNFTEKKQCKENNYCSKSDYGRVVYTYPKNNLRLFNKTPRGSKEWIKVYDKRSGSERSNKRKKIDYKIEHARVRSREQWFLRYSLAAICQHLDAWAKNANIDFKELCLTWQEVALK